MVGDAMNEDNSRSQHGSSQSSLSLARNSCIDRFLQTNLLLEDENGELTSAVIDFIVGDIPDSKECLYKRFWKPCRRQRLWQTFKSSEHAFIELKGKRTNHYTEQGYTRWDRRFIKSQFYGNSIRNGLRGNAFMDSLWKVKWQPFCNLLCYLGSYLPVCFAVQKEVEEKKQPL
ncbi:hypothetical protein AVEN_91762-1 [Araneus ventricosus]|uniref:Uncharacterized protein n=1 Tax=Araneus ventricosus TaxID=182803 RepID=A0A4Y2HUX4_ARAVE|nr:hypothetical protein AVEN_91762-1 [Araneus ventricosus]